MVQTRVACDAQSAHGRGASILSRLCRRAFELSYHPGQYRLIDVSEHGVQRQWGISPVVLDPALEEWIELPAQSRLAATSEPLFRRSDPLRHQSRWFSRSGDRRLARE